MPSFYPAVSLVHAARHTWLARTLAAWRWDRHEFAGSLGDLGTFIPLMIAMASQTGLDFSTSLFWAGIFNIITAFTFGIPMAVQPMKAIAAIALTHHMTGMEVIAAGAAVGGMVLMAGITGWINTLQQVIPQSVVRGIQLAVGLTLITKGVELVQHAGGWTEPKGYALAIVAAMVVLLLPNTRRVPAALVLCGLGIIVACSSVATGAGAALANPRSFGIALHVHIPTWDNMVQGFTLAAVPQLPLTLLNSVIAVSALAADLFPKTAPAPQRVAVSVGLMNIIGAMFGALPFCHGAGGLAGQYRFGARTGGSLVMLGMLKIGMAVGLGGTAMVLCQHFPQAILGVMLICSGMELGSAITALTGSESPHAAITVMVLTTGISLATHHVALGFSVGWIVSLISSYSKTTDQQTHSANATPQTSSQRQ